MKKGFTLIELLVVVLIIGILAAVALPQYQKAVKKAQGREVLVAINAVDKAFPLYLLEHGGLCEGWNTAEDGTFCSADSLVLEMPELTHFDYEENLFPEYASEAIAYSPTVSFQHKTGDATLTATYDNTTGKRESVTCSGSDCSAYFACGDVQTTQTCYNEPWDGQGYCPNVTSPISTCTVDM